MAQSAAATFHEAIELVNTGRINQAETSCRLALESMPEDVNLLGLLGAVLIKKREFEEAEAVLKTTIQLAPTFAKPYQDIGLLLLECGRPEEAIEHLQKATELDPSVALAHFNLGKGLAALGRGAEADVAFEASFDLDPVRKALALAAEHQREGRTQQAERTYRQVLQKDPGNVDAETVTGCVFTPDDVPCDDSVGCTTDTCDPADAGTDPNTGCVNEPDDAGCDNATFCDGVEFCDLVNDCQSPGDPCSVTTPICGEVNDVCNACANDSECVNIGLTTCDLIAGSCS